MLSMVAIVKSVMTENSHSKAIAIICTYTRAKERSCEYCARHSRLLDVDV